VLLYAEIALGVRVLGAAMQNPFLVFTIKCLRVAGEEQQALGKVSVEQNRDIIDHAVGISVLGGGSRSRVVDAIVIQPMNKWSLDDRRCLRGSRKTLFGIT